MGIMFIIKKDTTSSLTWYLVIKSCGCQNHLMTPYDMN